MSSHAVRAHAAISEHADMQVASRPTAYLTNDRFLGTSDRFEPALAQNLRTLRNTVEVPVVLLSAIAAPELAVGEP